MLRSRGQCRMMKVPLLGLGKERSSVYGGIRPWLLKPKPDAYGFGQVRNLAERLMGRLCRIVGILANPT
jgi:hypothetical protein